MKPSAEVDQLPSKTLDFAVKGTHFSTSAKQNVLKRGTSYEVRSCALDYSVTI